MTGLYYTPLTDDEIVLAAELRLGGHPEIKKWAKMGNTMYPAQWHLMQKSGWFALCGIEAQGATSHKAKQYCRLCLGHVLKGYQTMTSKQ